MCLTYGDVAIYIYIYMMGRDGGKNELAMYDRSRILNEFKLNIYWLSCLGVDYDIFIYKLNLLLDFNFECISSLLYSLN